MALNLSTCLANNISPVALAIGNNRVSTTSQAYTRGIAFDIGGQLFSASPALNDNNTWVVQTLSCANTTDWSCIASVGGTYTPKPGVIATTNPASWNGTQADWLSNGNMNSVFYNDDVRIGSSTLYGLPFYSYEYSASSGSNGTLDASGLSIAQNSSFLKAAVDSKMIGTKAWSLWPGNMANDVDGLLTLGGYDQSRVDGDFQQFDVDSSARDLYVQITKMEYKNSTKTTDLMGGSTKIWAYIEPWSDLISLQKTSFNTWISATSGKYSNITSRYEWSAIPEGTVTITFNNGHKTTIPAEDLFRRPQQYNSAGTLTVTNNTKYYHRFSLKDDRNDMILGTPFLTQKILATDWDKGTFSLANAIKTKMNVADRNIKPMCTPLGSAPVNPSPTPVPHKGNNVGAIAGGVVGGLAGLAIIGVLVFFLLRRKNNRKKEQPVAAAPETTHYPAADPPKYPSVGVHEAYYGGQPTQPGAPAYAPPVGVAEMHSPPPTHPGSPQMSYMSPSWRDSRMESHHDNQTVVNSTTSGSERGYARSPLDSDYMGATSGPLELPSSHEMHYNTQK